MFETAISYFTSWTDELLGGIHFGFALMTLVLGPFIFLRRKGNPAHRLAGHFYVLSMLSLNISALLIYDLTGRPNIFHLFAVLSLATLVPAFIAVRQAIATKEEKYYYRHAYFMVWSYFGVVMAAVAEIVTRAFDGLLLGKAGWTPFMIFLVITMAASAVLTSRLANATIPKILGWK